MPQEHTGTLSADIQNLIQTHPAAPAMFAATILIIIMIMIIMIIISIIRKRKQGPSVNFDALNGKQFEEFCATLLRKNGYQKVEVTKASGDHGADIIAYMDDVKFAIQCKRYETNVGNAAVQQVYAAKGIYGADVAVVMTNRTFTKQAAEEAECLHVKLWDRPKIQRLIASGEAKKKRSKMRRQGKYEKYA